MGSFSLPPRNDYKHVCFQLIGPFLSALLLSSLSLNELLVHHQTVAVFYLSTVMNETDSCQNTEERGLKKVHSWFVVRWHDLNTDSTEILMWNTVFISQMKINEPLPEQLLHIGGKGSIFAAT